MTRAGIITLTTDFGLADPYVAAMKGVILGIAPDVRLVDVTHQIPPQNTAEAAWVLEETVPYFPAGTIHLAVVDPGVGGARRPLAAAAGDQFFVGPDNGIFSAFFDAQSLVVELTETKFFLPHPSTTFHGRDIFAPVAAHLARGLALREFGPPVKDPIILARPQPERRGPRIFGQVIRVDRFGNLLSNLPGGWVAAAGQVTIGGRRITGLRRTYAEGRGGELIALVGSGGRLEIAVAGGSAAAALGVGVGAPVEAEAAEPSAD